MSKHNTWFSMSCTFWTDNINDTKRGIGKHRLCPHCGSQLEHDNVSDFSAQVESSIISGQQQPWYRDYIAWVKNRCLPSIDAGFQAFHAEKGKASG